MHLSQIYSLAKDKPLQGLHCTDLCVFAVLLYHPMKGRLGKESGSLLNFSVQQAASSYPFTPFLPSFVCTLSNLDCKLFRARTRLCLINYEMSLPRDNSEQSNLAFW